jgi:hypothetical protein
MALSRLQADGVAQLVDPAAEASSESRPCMRTRAWMRLEVLHAGMRPSMIRVEAADRAFQATHRSLS